MSHGNSKNNNIPIDDASSSSSSLFSIDKFLPFSSTVESPFWVQYCHLKLETLKLSEEPIPIHASYQVGSSRLQLLASSLDSNENATVSSGDADGNVWKASSSSTRVTQVPNDRICLEGSLLGFNTLEKFAKANKNELLANAYQQQIESSGKDKSKSHYAQTFQALAFADLKQHKVWYWFGFPQPTCRVPYTARHVIPTKNNESFHKLHYELPQRFQNLRLRLLQEQHELSPYFIATAQEMVPWSDTATVKQLLASEGQKVHQESTSAESAIDIVIGFLDTAKSEKEQSTSETVYGWPLRSLLVQLVLEYGMGGQTLTFCRWTAPLRRIDTSTPPPALCETVCESIREKHLEYFQVTLPKESDYDTNLVVGWERNPRGKAGPRSIDLAPLLDERHLAIQAADLNLKLMKWRLLPDLQVEKLQQTRVLLLGAGTLGCSVARTLLGWGVRKMTLLDYGKVSYSNPVRQNLFTLQDCHENQGAGKLKAQAAVDSLTQIAADVDAQAIHLSIPMPGHAEGLESVEASVSKLDALIQKADVVFLLTDTRESRWLPTIMAAAHDKILMNAALGLDSWLVMRHGGGKIEQSNESPTPTPTRWGCYFCNDVVAPENSTKNRTLDQQCTVTRPGLAPIAASMAVELMVGLLHHPLNQRAPAPKSMVRDGKTQSYNPRTSEADAASSAGPLGSLPHQIRGSLVSYQMMTPSVPAFACCTGCSPNLIDAYKEDKVSLVHKVCQSTDSKFLEDLTGLTAFREEANEKLAMLMEDDDVWDSEEE